MSPHDATDTSARAVTDSGANAATATEPPDAGVAEPRLRPRGSTQGGVRQYNERVLLHAIRLHGPLPGAELARLTRLTAQTVSQITKRLLDDGLLRKGAPQRGKVGQPAVPLALNPDGAYAIGIKVGRRSVDVLLVDFTGTVRRRWTQDYRYPEPAQLLDEIGRRLVEIQHSLSPLEQARVQGVGMAAPLSLGGWRTLLDMPPEVAAHWQTVDLRAAVQRLSPWPVLFLKDTAAACVAELVAGRGHDLPSFLYVFVDTFIGGGLVLDSHLRTGLHGNAGAIGSLPLAPVSAQAHAQAVASGTPPPQLLSVASLVNLEQRYQAAGLAPEAAADARALQPPWRAHTEAWLDEAAAALALAVSASACLLDLDCVIVDGSFSRGLQAALLQALDAALARHDWEGTQRPALAPGRIGPDARALGGALLPLHANFAPDRELFLKIVAD